MFQLAPPVVQGVVASRAPVPDINHRALWLLLRGPFGAPQDEV